MKKLNRNIAVFKPHDNIGYAAALQNVLATVPDAKLSVFDSDTNPDKVFNVDKHSLVLIPGIDRVPGGLKGTIGNYLQKGGRILTLGGPAFETETFNYNGTWMPQNDYLAHELNALSDKKKFRIFNAADPADVDAMTRSSNTMERPFSKTIGDYGLKDSTAQLHVEVDLECWDNLHYTFTPPKGKKFTTLCFNAKGDAETFGLYLEVIDRDGARWAASVRLDEEWSFHALSAADFHFWRDGRPAKTKQLDFNNAATFVFGFALSGVSMKLGHHTFTIDSPFLACCDKLNLPMGNQLDLEGVSPMHELYPITNAANIVTCDNQVFVNKRDYVVPSSLVSCHPGRQGTGYDNKRACRFIPLLRVTDEKGLHSGYAAWINVFSSVTDKNEALEGCMVGCFSAASDDFYNMDGLAAVAETVKAMLSPALLVEGGTNEYTYVEPDTDRITVGANFVTYPGCKSNITATVTLYEDEKELYRLDGTPTVLCHNIGNICGEYSISGGKPNLAVTTLLQDGKVIDCIRQSIRYWSPKPVDQRNYVHIEDGCFIRDGKILNLFGVNYMPSSGVSERDGRLFEHYVCAAAYDPDVIDYDLAHIKDIGMNAISVFVYNESIRECNNILDLICRAEELGIVTDLSIRNHVYPMSYVETEVQELIKKLRFDENDSIVAYDIAWEPRIGHYVDNSFIGRKHWDGDWAEWVIEQYGSVEHAEALWGCPINRDEDGNIIGVTDAMLDDTSDAYTKIVSAYRRFIDDIVSKIFSEKLTHLRALAPDQLVSLRMSMSGSAMTTGAFKPSNFCYDFSSFASTLDFMEPEGYCLNGSEEAALQVVFSNAYNRYIQPGTPIVWKEYGRHVWSGSNFTNNKYGNLQQMLDGQREYYRTSLEYCLRSHTAGMFAWYYAGGFRIGENSDYGIVNPDGSDRPATKLLREYAPKFLALGKCPKADVVLTVERDDSNRGIFAMYDKTKAEVRRAFDEGKSVAFMNKKQSIPNELVYADTVLDEAVGGTAAEGAYPLRYVNGMIKNVEQCCGSVKITVCNTLPTVWKTGTVSIIAGDTVVAVIDRDVPYLADISVCASVSTGTSLRLSIEGKPFGMSYTVK